MRCPHCTKPIGDSKLAVDNHYKKFHPAEYEVMKQRAIEQAAKHGKIGFSREKYKDEATKYMIEKCVKLKDKKLLEAKDKQNGIKHTLTGSKFGYGA